MAVTSFKDFDLADADREWDGDAAEKRVRKWADAEDEPNQKYRDTHLWYDADNNDNFTAYKLLICDVVKGKLVAVPRAVMAAGGSHAGRAGRRRHSGCGCRQSQAPFSEVLPQDGPHTSLGRLIRLVPGQRSLSWMW